MSVVRFGPDSEVYVFETASAPPEFDPSRATWECCGCTLPEAQAENGYWWTQDEATMRAHLLRHRDAGHRVPDRAIEAFS